MTYKREETILGKPEIKELRKLFNFSVDKELSVLTLHTTTKQKTTLNLKNPKHWT